MEPIKPKDVDDAKSEKLPDEVIKVFNDLIVEEWNGYSATIVQNAAAKKISNSMGITLDEVYNRGLLDVEHVFRKAGWNVKYDKPGYNETYEATFEFSKRKRKE
jgi:hypothetical protein